ncbi:hypothetical protein HMPREF9441_03061 [Paraprevotella clara YIT 11840]|uniref:Uncharacterized protein n=1 Tax=Paraprevotella clara YIT 11840 TaxID=762968 RepID=G5SUK1_9BACT|nr:hypothetical protein HMPREF9441_03061 [Paraprevotella clara YIT 11840]
MYVGCTECNVRFTIIKLNVGWNVRYQTFFDDYSTENQICL